MTEKPREHVTRARCESRWQQMPSQPVIQCARKEGHPAPHYNTRARRQWKESNA